MNTIRTTISLREDIYDRMRLLAATERTSLSKVINHKLTVNQSPDTNEDIERKIKETRDLFRKLSANTPKIDPVTAIREMREERMNQLTSR
jgi:predicted CopG family antitoxin